jgi:hypothetical protein
VRKRFGTLGGCDIEVLERGLEIMDVQRLRKERVAWMDAYLEETLPKLQTVATQLLQRYVSLIDRIEGKTIFLKPGREPSSATEKELREIAASFSFTVSL